MWVQHWVKTTWNEVNNTLLWNVCSLFLRHISQFCCWLLSIEITNKRGTYFPSYSVARIYYTHGLICALCWLEAPAGLVYLGWTTTTYLQCLDITEVFLCLSWFPSIHAIATWCKFQVQSSLLYRTWHISSSVHVYSI